MFRFILINIILITMIRYTLPQNLSRNNQEVTASVNEALRVFLDCDECDFNYIRINIPFVNFTRDPELAQVHIIISINNTGSGGKRYNLLVERTLWESIKAYFISQPNPIAKESEMKV